MLDVAVVDIPDCKQRRLTIIVGCTEEDSISIFEWKI
jgi:hypothetical protein